MPLKEFLNECKEWHAFWLGIARSFFPMRTDKLHPDLKQDIDEEYHYHLFGYFLAKATQIITPFVIGYLIAK